MKDTEQLFAVSEQFVELSEPSPVEVKVTVPVEGASVPGEVSVTTTLQVEATLTRTGVAQLTVRLVDLGFTLTVSTVLVLPLWVVSPLYVPVMLAFPVTDGVKLALQLEAVALTLVS